jgi:hypothetical protein
VTVAVRPPLDETRRIFEPPSTQGASNASASCWPKVRQPSRLSPVANAIHASALDRLEASLFDETRLTEFH